MQSRCNLGAISMQSRCNFEPKRLPTHRIRVPAGRSPRHACCVPTATICFTTRCLSRHALSRRRLLRVQTLEVAGLGRCGLRSGLPRPEQASPAEASTSAAGGGTRGAASTALPAPPLNPSLRSISLASSNTLQVCCAAGGLLEEYGCETQKNSVATALVLAWPLVKSETFGSQTSQQSLSVGAHWRLCNQVRLDLNKMTN